MTALRPYQADAVARLRAAYAAGARAPLLVLPTGGGKTLIFSHICAAAAARGRRALVLVHRRELIRPDDQGHPRPDGGLPDGDREGSGMTQHPYTYTILRYVHDPRAWEALNVGVVLHVAAERKLLARVRSTFGRVKAAFPDLDGEAFKQALREVERGIERVAREIEKGGLLAAAGDAAAFARRGMPEDDSALQWSPVGSGLTADAQATLERLYDRFVQRHDDRVRRRRDDEDIWRPVSGQANEAEPARETT